jgi:hypothetical protein
MTALRRTATAIATAALAAILCVAPSGGVAGAAAAPAPATSAFAAVTPCRLLDTRQDPPGRLPAHGVVTIQVAGKCAVPADATAAALTLTATGTGGAGFVTAYPAGETMPLASNLNYVGGSTRANGAIIRLGAGGAISLYVEASTDVVVDVSGAWSPATSAHAGRLVPMAPTRVLDTRTSGGRVAAGSVIHVPLPDGVPASATALAVNITATDSLAAGFITASAAGAPAPEASNLNWDGAGQTRAATSIVPASAAGIDMYVLTSVDVIVDITGWFTGADAAESAAGLFVPTEPTRLLDTRQADGPSGGPRLWGGGGREVDVSAVTGGAAAAVVANLTVVDSDGPGFWLAHAAGQAFGNVSSINTDDDRETLANLAIVPVSTRGLGVNALTTAHFVVDLTGWFTGVPAAAPLPVPANVNVDRHVTIISDSAFAGMRWSGALGGLQGFQETDLLQSCRRLVVPSCRGREGITPPSTVVEIAGLPQPRPSDILVVANGYDDSSSRFSGDFDTVIAAARGRGYQQIVWTTYRTGGAYRAGEVDYDAMNATLHAKIASGAFPDVQIWDYDGYAEGADPWFVSDGIHETVTGAWGTADWISRHVAEADGRACPHPWNLTVAADNPCSDPDPLPATIGVPDIHAIYGH